MRVWLRVLDIDAFLTPLHVALQADIHVLVGEAR